MKKFYNRLLRKGKAEDGQSMLEFVLVFPIFMLILAMTFDFGWLFYHQISVENSARNAARVACVEYTHVALQNDGTPYVEGKVDGDPGSGKYQRTYTLDTYKSVLDGNLTSSERVQEMQNLGISDQERRILLQVQRTVPKEFDKVTVTVSYSEDQDYKATGLETYTPASRSNGDVTVIVRGVHHAITPLVNWDAKPGESRMTRNLACKSVYKVEENLTFRADENDGD
ncbi:TadE/TadG family type IV pilus assembly protein [Eubacterium sp.]